MVLRTAVRSIIRRTSLSRYKKSTVHRRLVFLNVVYSTKNLSIQDRAVHMKEKNESFLLFFLFLEGERERGSYGGERLGPTYPDRTP